MDLTQLANLGEFIGGLAVLVTLVYLALEVRQTNLLAKADSLQKAFANYSSWRRMLVDEEINQLWFKSLNEAELSPQEEHRLYIVTCELAYAGCAALASSQASGHRALVEATAFGVARELGSERLRQTWTQVAGNLSANGFAEFSTAVTRQLDTATTAA